MVDSNNMLGYFPILAWVAVWFLVFGIPNFFKFKYKFSYWKNPILFSSWYLGFAVLELIYIKFRGFEDVTLNFLLIFIALLTALFLIKVHSGNMLT